MYIYIYIYIYTCILTFYIRDLFFILVVLRFGLSGPFVDYVMEAAPVEVLL